MRARPFVLAAAAALWPSLGAAEPDVFAIERVVHQAGRDEFRLASLDGSLTGVPAGPDQLRAIVGRRSLLEPELVARLLSLSNMTVDELLVALIPLAKDVSRPMVSGYPVGAVGLGESGAVYFGGSLSFIGVPNGQSVHAEQAVIVNAKRHGETRLSALAVSDEPCGMCRQFLHELGTSDTLRVVVPGKAPASLSELLPRGFVFSGTPPNPLSAMDARLVVKTAGTDDSDLARAAIAAARAANSKYNPSGVALRLSDGRVVTGGYIEISGGNPSLPPLQSALVALALDGQPYSSIREAILAELNVEESRVIQEAMTRELLRHVAPHSTFQTVTLERWK